MSQPVIPAQDFDQGVGIGNRCGFIAKHDYNFLCRAAKANDVIGNPGSSVNEQEVKIMRQFFKGPDDSHVFRFSQFGHFFDA